MVLTDRVRAAALADRSAYLMAGEPPIPAEQRVDEFAELLAQETPKEERAQRLTPEVRAVYSLLGFL